MYQVTGSITYSTGGNRDTALANINSALTAFNVTNVATALSAGVNTNGAAGLTISIEVPDSQVEAVRAALRTAWTSTARATTGHWIATVKR